MKTCALFFILFSISFFAKSQTDTKPKEEVLVFAEQMPEYPGGQDSMVGFLKQNIIYPALAKNNWIEGRVLISFVLSADGKISDVEALTKRGWGLEEEAIRVVKLMPDWIPGKQNGKSVNVKFTLPVTFRLSK